MMHLEAFKMTAQILNFEIPGLKSKFLNFDYSSESSFLSFNEQTISPYYENYAFHFDNEIFNGETTVKPFKIQSSCVSLKSFLNSYYPMIFSMLAFGQTRERYGLLQTFTKNLFIRI